MKNFFNVDLARGYGYGMAVYIAAQTAALQRGIDATNMKRKVAGRRLLEDATVEEVISALRSNGTLPAAPGMGGVRRGRHQVTRSVASGIHRGPFANEMFLSRILNIIV
jgi:hypothetical protein